MGASEDTSFRISDGSLFCFARCRSGGRPPPHLRRLRRRPAAAAGGARPVVRLLQAELPQGGVHRAELRAGRGAPGRGPRRGPPAPPLPRLLRPGLRRLRPARRLRHRPRREAGAAQPHAPPLRLQGHQRHPQPPAEGLRRRRRLLLRRPRARRPRLRRRVGRPELPGAPGAARQHQLRDAAGRARRPPAAHRHRPGSPGRALQAQPGRRRPGGALRRAHHRPRPLHLLRGPALPAPGPDPERHLRRPPPADLPGHGHRPEDGAGRADAQHVRQQVLREPGEPGGALHLGPGPLQQRRHQGHGRQVRAEPEGLLRPVRVLHGEDGADQGAHGEAGPDTQQLLRAQQPSRAAAAMVHLHPRRPGLLARYFMAARSRSYVPDHEHVAACSYYLGSID